MAPKDRDSTTNKGDIIYRYKFDHLGSTVEYISDTDWTFGDGYKEHLRAPSPIYDHANTTSHFILTGHFSVVNRRSQSITRSIQKAIFIRVNDCPLNRNLGKYQLPHIWGWGAAGYAGSLSTVVPCFSKSSLQSHLATPTRGHMHITLVSIVLPEMSPPSPFHIGYK